jgi:hypothetical protein
MRNRQLSNRGQPEQVKNKEQIAVSFGSALKASDE